MVPLFSLTHITLFSLSSLLFSASLYRSTLTLLYCLSSLIVPLTARAWPQADRQDVRVLSTHDLDIISSLWVSISLYYTSLYYLFSLFSISFILKHTRLMQLQAHVKIELYVHLCILCASVVHTVLHSIEGIEWGWISNLQYITILQITITEQDKRQ